MKNCIDAKIKQCWKYTEQSGEVVKVWCKGVVVGVLKNSRVHVQWDKDYLRPGGLKVIKEKNLMTLYNKHKD